MLTSTTVIGVTNLLYTVSEACSIRESCGPGQRPMAGEVIGPGDEPMTSVLLSGHVITLTLKYLCS